jgi:murein DD-endopeptidase MepM/ murein hydrolase activator NlpD
MLYAQLSQQLERTARATTAGAGKNPLPAGAAALKPAPPAETAAALREEDLYSPLKAGEEAEEPSEDENDLARALKEIRADLEEPVPPSEKGAAIRAELAAGLPSSGREADGPEAAAEGSPPEKSSGFRSATWQREGLVSARPKPASSLGRREVQAVQENTGAPETAPSGGRSRGLPQEAGLWPHEGKVLSPFGRTEDADGGRRWNSGLTLEGIPGDPVRAVMDGTVLFSGRREGYGQTIILEHRGGLLSYYGNVRSANLKVGDAVARGTEFAEIQAQDSPAGEKENSAPLFFALKRGEVALDPEKVLGRPSAGEKSASR